MDRKYIKFYRTFHKKFKNDENLILCSKTLSHGGIKRLYLSKVNGIELASNIVYLLDSNINTNPIKKVEL